MGFKSVIPIVVLIVLGIVLVPTIWSVIYDDVLICHRYNESKTDNDCATNTAHTGTTPAQFCSDCVSGTAKTLLQLIPFIFVGSTVIGGIVMYKLKQM